MNKKFLGVHSLAGKNVSLYVEPGYGGSFTFSPDKKSIPEIIIGMSYDKWERTIAIVLHEAMEFEMASSDCRYFRSNDFGEDHSCYQFIFDHPKFSDLCGRVGGFMSTALPVIAAEWNKRHGKKQSAK